MEKKALLVRTDEDNDQTLGVFVFESKTGEKIKLFTMELPWKNNARSVSSIPKGTYKVITTMSPRFKKDMWLLVDVPGRDGIRIHSANYARELNGCIALGMSKSDIDGDGNIDIVASRKAIDLAFEHLGESFELEII